MTITLEMVTEHNLMCQKLKLESGEGEWINEINRLEFKHAGFDCLINRNQFLAWCGYVGIPKTHPCYGKEILMQDYTLPEGVHGGVSYSQECHELICHQTENKEDNLWWIGFDCAHAYDLIPYLNHIRKKWGGNWQKIELDCNIKYMDVYRNIDYVTNETKNLAEQLLQIQN